MCGWFLCQQIELSSRNSCLFSRFEIHTRTMGRGELRQVSPRKMDVSLSLGLSLIYFYLYKVRIESRPQDSRLWFPTRQRTNNYWLSSHWAAPRNIYATTSISALRYTSAISSLVALLPWALPDMKEATDLTLKRKSECRSLFMMERQSSDSTATIDFPGAVPTTVAPAGTVSKASVWTSAICILGLSAMSAGNSMRPGRTTIRRTVGRPLRSLHSQAAATSTRLVSIRIP
jgi:hypothetical protein